jgi:hypothetical protein
MLPTSTLMAPRLRQYVWRHPWRLSESQSEDSLALPTLLIGWCRACQVRSLHSTRVPQQHVTTSKCGLNKYKCNLITIISNLEKAIIQIVFLHQIITKFVSLQYKVNRKWSMSYDVTWTVYFRYDPDSSESGIFYDVCDVIIRIQLIKTIAALYIQ